MCGPNNGYFQRENTIKAFGTYLAIKHNDFNFRVCIFFERIYGFLKIMTIPSLVFLPTVDSLSHHFSLNETVHSCVYRLGW